MADMKAECESEEEEFFHVRYVGIPYTNGHRAGIIEPRIVKRDRFEREGDISLHSCNNNLNYTFDRDGGIASGEAVVFPGKVRKEVL